MLSPEAVPGPKKRPFRAAGTLTITASTGLTVALTRDSRVLFNSTSLRRNMAFQLERLLWAKSSQRTPKATVIGPTGLSTVFSLLEPSDKLETYAGM